MKRIVGVSHLRFRASFSQKQTVSKWTRSSAAPPLLQRSHSQPASEDLQTYLEESAGRTGGRLEKFSLTATQAILDFDAIAPEESFTLSYRLRAKYPIRARTFASRVYEYYDPDVSSFARPFQLEVRP